MNPITDRSAITSYKELEKKVEHSEETFKSRREEVSKLISQIASRFALEENLPGNLIIFQDPSSHCWIKTADTIPANKMVVKIQDSHVFIDDKDILSIESEEIITKALNISIQARIADLFRKHLKTIPHYIDVEKSNRPDNCFLATTNKLDGKVVFFQDQAAWETRGKEGNSFSINLDRQTIFRNNASATPTESDLEFIERLFST